MKRTWRTCPDTMAMAMSGALARTAAADLAIAGFGYVVTSKHNPQVRPKGLGGSTD